MQEQVGSQTNHCKCIGDKKLKALEKKISETKIEISQLRAEIEIIKKVLTNR